MARRRVRDAEASLSWHVSWWQVLGSNQRRLSRRFYRQPSMHTICGRRPAATSPAACSPTAAFRPGSVREKLRPHMPSELRRCTRSARTAAECCGTGTEPRYGRDRGSRECDQPGSRRGRSGWPCTSPRLTQGPVTHGERHAAVQPTHSGLSPIVRGLKFGSCSRGGNRIAQRVTVPQLLGERRRRASQISHALFPVRSAVSDPR